MPGAYAAQDGAARPSVAGGRPLRTGHEPGRDTAVGAGRGPAEDVLEGAGGRRRPPPRWAPRTPRQRRLAAAVAALVGAPVAVALAASPVRDWYEERRLRDEVAVQVELGIDASSSAWSPSGRGRVDHFAVVRNEGPRPLRVRGVRIEHGQLLMRGRPVDQEPVPPGRVAHVPLSVELDCRRPAPSDRGSGVGARVTAVAASGRTADVTAPVSGEGPVSGTARMLCRLDPDRRVADLSGPVLP